MPPPTDPLIEVVDLGRTFRSGDVEVPALREVDLRVMPGDYLSVMGPSGSGKSTLLNVLGLLDRQTSGSYRIDGREVSDLREAERNAVRAARIGFVFQAFHLLAHRSVVENVALATVYSNVPRSERRDRAVAAIERVGLGARAGFRPSRLSGGERQRVAIARAIVTRPSLLLCDEPTGNLDTNTSAAILDLFDELRRDGLTLIVVTHDESVSARAGRTVHMLDGYLTEDGA